MRANNLREVLNFFTHNKPLVSKEELETYFVERPMAPLHEMEVALREEKERVKVLFTGHRGSGKSTELNRLAMNSLSRQAVTEWEIECTGIPYMVSGKEMWATYCMPSMPNFYSVTACRVLLRDDNTICDIARLTRQ